MDQYNFQKTNDFQPNEKNNPKTVVLHKDECGFGFTLRHFIVYPPSNIAPSNLTLCENEKTSVHLSEWKPDDQNKPMDTIFIREVKEGSPAYHAGLTKGDRIIAINNHPLIGKSYSDIIHLILESGNILQLLVVPKEDDILQLYFASSAYEPVNRECKPECDSDWCYLSPYDPLRKYLKVKTRRNYYYPKISTNLDEEEKHYGEHTASYKLPDRTLSPLTIDSSSQTPIHDSIRSAFFSNQSPNPFASIGGIREDVENQNDNGLDCSLQTNSSIRHSYPLTDSSKYNGSHSMADRRNLFLSNNDLNDIQDNPKNISPINFVAQRCQQIESGSLLAESLERMQMYKSELSRMSKSSQCPIVSTQTAHFETLSAKTKVASADRTSIADSAYSEIGEYSDIAQIDDVEKGESRFSPTPTADQVIYRRKNQQNDSDELYATRRVSYLRATADETYIELNHSDKDKSSDSNKNQDSFHEEKENVDNEKDLFAPNSEAKDIDECHESSSSDANSLYGWVICKTVLFEGKRSSDRSWRHLWAILRNNMLYLLKERREPDNRALTSEEHAIDVACSIAKVASDYVKRKNVLRLNIINGTEFLIQTESHKNMLKWLKALQHFECGVKLPDWTSDSSVLKKAAAYEQRVMGHKTSAIAQQLSHPMKKLVFWYRSPTEHTSMMKARRSSHGDELALSRIGLMWCDRMVHSWKKVQNTEDVQIGASLNVRLELAPVGSYEHIPLLVELCVHVIEERGLDIVGIYRIPGNNAAVSILSDIVNKGLNDEALEDPRWRDVNVVSSLLKAFFRKLPEPLLTTHLYPKFILASKIEDPHKRLTTIKDVLQELPIHHFQTLKFLMHHLKKVVENSGINKMESRNLAIVFGPTLVRLSDNNMVTMVTDMSHQCHLIETMISYDKWLFQNSSPEPVRSPTLVKNFLKLEPDKEEPVQSFKPRTRSKQSLCKSKRSGIIEQDLDEFNYLSGENASFERDENSKISSQNGSESGSLTKGEERLHPTYNQLSSFANLKVKQFEMETKAMLKREGTASVSKAGPMEWERIEKEWQKAKLELEEEDFLDRLADDPLFISFLLSHPRDFTVKDCHTSEPSTGSKQYASNAVTSNVQPVTSSVNGASKMFHSVDNYSIHERNALLETSFHHQPSENNSLKKSASLSTFQSSSNDKTKDLYHTDRTLSKTTPSTHNTIAFNYKSAFKNNQSFQDSKVIPSKPWKPSTSSIAELSSSEKPGETSDKLLTEKQDERSLLKHK